MKTQNKIIKQDYNSLINSLGVANTIRFIQYFSPAKGGNTKKRHQWLDEKLCADVLLEMKALQENDTKVISDNEYTQVDEFRHFDSFRLTSTTLSTSRSMTNAVPERSRRA